MKPDEDPRASQTPLFYWSFDNGNAMLINGDWFPITRWIDADGLDTDDMGETEMVVGGPDKNGQYWNWRVREFPWDPIQ